MKIAMEQKVRLGCLENPIRFTGYHMLKELGLTFSGENYEDFNRWGQRMADDSITSEQVIYLGHVPFSRAAVQQYRAALEEQGLAPSSINVRLAAVRKLASEAAENGLLAPELAAGIARVKGARRLGVRGYGKLSYRFFDS